MSIAPSHDPSVRCSRKQETRLRRTQIGACVDDIKGRNGASLMADDALGAGPSIRDFSRIGGRLLYVRIWPRMARGSSYVAAGLSLPRGLHPWPTLSVR